MSGLHQDRFGNFHFDEQHTQLFANGKPIHIEGFAFRLLKTLFERRGKVVTYSVLVKSLYGIDVEIRKCIEVPQVHTLQMHKRTLCTRIGDNWIETHNGRGYEFLADDETTKDNSNETHTIRVEEHTQKRTRDFLPESAKAAKAYSWDDMLAGAKYVSEQIYKDGELLIDAVLTFPGASSIFCGLVLTMLPLKVFMRIPVYTGIFVDSKIPTSKQMQYFHEIKAKSFKVLIPKDLTENEKRIIVIDDSIISGGVMEIMRKSLAKRCGPDNVIFACCICYEGRTLLTVTPPEIVGLQPLEGRIRFPMPWGRESYSFEEAFVPDTSSTKKR